MYQELKKAVREGNLEFIKQNFNEINFAYGTDYMIFYIASECGHLNMIKYFVENIINNIIIKKIILKNSVSYGHLDIFKYMIEEQKMNIHLKDFNGNSLLMIASICNQKDILEYIINNGGQINSINNNSYNALTYGLTNKMDLEIFEILLKNNINIDNIYQLKNDFTSQLINPLLHFNKTNQDIEIIKFFIRFEKDINIIKYIYNIYKYDNNFTKFLLYHKLIDYNYDINSVNKYKELIEEKQIISHLIKSNIENEIFKYIY